MDITKALQFHLVSRWAKMSFVTRRFRLRIWDALTDSQCWFLSENRTS